MAISCALWAKGFYNIDEGVETVLRLIKYGTRDQKMTASYFILFLQDREGQMKAAKEAILSYPDDIELAACYMPSFMISTTSYIYKLIEDKGMSRLCIQDHKVRRPDTLSIEEMFENEEEGERIYKILKKMMERIPKKGLLLFPCIFPWHEVAMSQSDIALRLCFIAWMLQKDILLEIGRASCREIVCTDV